MENKHFLLYFDTIEELLQFNQTLNEKKTKHCIKENKKMSEGEFIKYLVQNG